MIDKVLKGLARPTTGHFQPGSPAYDDTIKPLEYDWHRARQLLDEAGWIDSDHNGIRDKKIDGRKVEARFELLLNSDILDYITLAEIIQGQSESDRRGDEDHADDVRGHAAKAAGPQFRRGVRRLESHLAQRPVRRLGQQPGRHSGQLEHRGLHATSRSTNGSTSCTPPTTTTSRSSSITRFSGRSTPISRARSCSSKCRPAALNGRLKNVKFYKTPPCIDMREWYATRATCPERAGYYVAIYRPPAAADDSDARSA